MLTDEQREAIKYVIATLAATQLDSATLHRRVRALKSLLAAHNAGAQGANVHTCALCGSTGDCKAKDPRLLNDCQGAWYRPAAHPQPMPQTDAARDQLRHFANAERFSRAVFADDSAFADWVISRSRHVLAEIERLDRAKGE